MRILKIGVAAAIILGTVLGLLWATEVVPREDLVEGARMGYLVLLVLALAAAALRLIRRPEAPDAADRRAP